MAKEIVSNLANHKISIISLITAVPTVWALATFIDSRYASAGDVQKLIESQNMIMKQQDDKFSDMRKQQLEDQIFILEMRKGQQGGKLSPLDEALLKRYSRQLNEQTKQQTKKQTKKQTKNA